MEQYLTGERVKDLDRHHIIVSDNTVMGHAASECRQKTAKQQEHPDALGKPNHVRSVYRY